MTPQPVKSLKGLKQNLLCSDSYLEAVMELLSKVCVQRELSPERGLFSGPARAVSGRLPLV